MSACRKAIWLDGYFDCTVQFFPPVTAGRRLYLFLCLPFPRNVHSIPPTSTGVTMLRIHQIANAAAAKAYYTTSDYFLDTPGEWLGKGAAMLGLSGRCDQRDFNDLCDNINPTTGLPLTVVTRDGRRTGWDFNFNATKSVSIARELVGDIRIEEAHREAVDYAIGEVEKDMATRVRIGGKDDDRLTGNLVGMHVIHRTTRPNEDDQLPDMSLHSHVVVFNATFDPVENRWKAAQIGQIKHDAPYYEALYHNRLASNLRELDYGIRRKDKAFEITGISDELVQKFSRRTATVEATKELIEKKYGVTISPEAKAKLGATTRLHKLDIREDDLAHYWVSRLTDDERSQLSSLEGQPSYISNDRQGVEFAIAHLFERNSVVDERRLYETAIRHGIGSVTPEGVQAEAKQQGVLTKAGEATTREVLAEESRIIQFALSGRGSMRPLGVPQTAVDNSLSIEQRAIVRHVLESPDEVILVVGDAGTGKTRSIKATFAAIDRPVAMLAPSVDASRRVLREDGFQDANTVASFLASDKRQSEIQNGVIWIDEAGQLPIRDLSRLVEIARQQDARLVLQGDPKQHKSVVRHGNMLEVLQEHAGLPVGRLSQIWRQERDDYKQAVAALAKGDMAAGYDALSNMGWVRETDGSNHQLVDDYLEAIATRKANGEMTSAIIIAPTHSEGSEITSELRARLKEQGTLTSDERVFERLKQISRTEAERGDIDGYDGTEVLQFHRNSGTFKTGQRIRVADLRPGDVLGKPANYAIYRPEPICLASGDRIRITSGGKTKDRKHKLESGTEYLVSGFTDKGDIRLSNGRTIDADFAHLSHAYTATSFAGQGRTVDRVLISMGNESRPAINAEQFYVCVSRGREKATIYSDLCPDEVRAAIMRSDNRKSATELMHPLKSKSGNDSLRKLMKRVSHTYRQLRERADRAIRNALGQPERDSYAR
jgi:conjugative relaxase-like TrwC/TraI family protein